MSENKTPLEIWIMSTKDKNNYPTGNPNVKPRRIRTNIPFNVTKPEEIDFFRTLIKANSRSGNCPFREMTQKEVDDLGMWSVVDETLNKQFRRRRSTADAENTALKAQIESLQKAEDQYLADIKEKESKLGELEEEVKVLNSSSATDEIKQLVNKLKEAENKNKKLANDLKNKNEKIQELKNEVK